MNRDQANSLEDMEVPKQRAINVICDFVCTLAAGKRSYFQDVMEKYFATFMKSGKEANKFDWKCVNVFYSVAKSYLKDLCLLKMFCTFVFKLFYLFECEDEKFIIKIIYLYHELLKKWKTSIGLCYNCMKMNSPKHYICEGYCMEDVLKGINNVQSIYNFTNREFYADLTIDVIHEGDYATLQFLVKYGLSYFPDDIFKRVRMELELLKSKNALLTQLRRGNDEELVDVEKKNLVKSFFTRLFADSNPNLRRILLTAIAVNIVLSKCIGDAYYPDSVKCFNLYVLTVPEAAISPVDLEYIFHTVFGIDQLFLRAEMFSSFQELFPETPMFPSPRSLKYLCRCKVRECIRLSPTLTNSLSQVQMPSSVKDYLLFLRN